MELIMEAFNRSGLKNKQLFLDIFEYIKKHSDTITPSKMSTDLKANYGKLSHNTVRKYLDKMVALDVVSEYDRYYIKSINSRQNKQLGYNRVYLINNAYDEQPSRVFRCTYGDSDFCSIANTGNNEKKPIRIDNKTLIKELLKDYYSLKTGVVDYFWKEKDRTSHKKAVDISFIAENGDEKMYISLAKSRHEADFVNRAFRTVRDFYPKIIVFENDKDYIKYPDGIQSYKFDDFMEKMRKKIHKEN